MSNRAPLAALLALVVGVGAEAQNVSEARDYLPSDFYEIAVEQYAETEPGYFFLGLYRSGYQPPNYIVTFDSEGVPIYYRDVCVFDYKYHPSNGTITFFTIKSVRGIPAGFLHILDTRYRTERVAHITSADWGDAHEALFEPDGDVLYFGRDLDTVDMSQYVANGDTSIIVDVNIYRQTPSGEVELVWKPSEFLPFTDSETSLAQGTIDYIHSNAIEFDDDAYLVSHRNMSSITKIDTATGEVIWRWGGKSNQFTFVGDSLGFSAQHMIRKTPQATYTIFDNGNNHYPSFSRGLEYELDQDSMVATLVQEFVTSPTLYSYAMCSMQRLDEGNTLLGFSHNHKGFEFDETGAELATIEIAPSYALFYRMFKYNIPNTAFVADGDSAERDTLRFNGDGSTDTITLFNPYSHDLAINAVFSGSQTFSSAEDLPITVPSGGSHTVTITYNTPPDSLLPPPSEDHLYIASYTDTLGFARDIVALIDDPVAVERDDETPDEFLVAGAYPNPFNAGTLLEYQLAEPAETTIEIYSTLGEKLHERSGRKVAGVHRERLDFSLWSAGVYVVVVSAKYDNHTARTYVKTVLLK
ncbi:MAG: T9SS type A sorting domain-containing protein [Ignavibacteriales bacterium]|nr:T9SS type A sorting domain-containing protein [Ignavibacteriales bacterium]